jgi:hypothetical protein
MLRISFALILTCLSLSGFTQEYDAELLNYKTIIFIRKGILYKTINAEIKINNRAGEKYSTVSIPYSKLIKLSKLDAYLKDKLGLTVKTLQKKDIIDKSSIADYSLYEDDYIKEFTLKHNSYPYSICYSYEVQQDEFISIDDWLPVLNRKVPTINAILQVEVPLNYNISFTSKFTDSFSTDTTDLQIMYTWSASYKNIFIPEISSPSLSQLLPEVKIVPLDFKYNLPGSFRSWLSFGNWHNDLLRGLSDLPPAEQAIIQNITSGISDKREIIKKLYWYLQDHTRYINITIETGGLKPYPASYVAENKYGDCKALSNYFKSVLAFKGIKSFYTKVLAGDPIIEIDKSFPYQQFNHIILCVPMPEDTIWLDCTSDGPFNHLGTFTQNRDVFLVEEGKSHFTRTPALTSNDVAEIRRVRITYAGQNQATAIFSNSYRGEVYESLFYLSHSVSDQDKSQIIRNNYVENGFELISFSLIPAPRDSPEISLNYSARSGNVYKVYGNDLIISILPFSMQRYEDPKTRKLPIQLDYPVNRTDSLEYEIPIGYSLNNKLLNQTITSDFGQYKIESNLKERKVKIVKSFILNSGKYPVDKYLDFYRFIKKVVDSENSNVIVTNKQF